MKTELKNSERASAFSASVTAQVPSWRLSRYSFSWFQFPIYMVPENLRVRLDFASDFFFMLHCIGSSHLPDFIPHFIVVFVGILCSIFTKEFVAFLFL